MNTKCFHKSRQNDNLSPLTLFEKSRTKQKNCIIDNPHIYRQRQGTSTYRKMIGKDNLPSPMTNNFQGIDCPEKILRRQL